MLPITMIDLFATFIVFFAVIDPIGTVPVYMAVTRTLDAARQRRVAVVAVLVAAAILLFFVVLGEVILHNLGIPIAAFQIAGGIILFLFSLSMIFGHSKPEDELKLVHPGDERAIFPLAMPSIASPGAILAAVLLTKNAQVSFWEQTLVSVVMLGVLTVQLVLLLSASFIHRVIGDAGASVISRVMGMLLAAVATTNVIEGTKLAFDL